MRSLTSGLCSPARIENLGLLGCRIRIGDSQCFRRSEPVEMTFCVRQLPVRVQGVIRRARPDQTIGVEFTLLTQRGRRQLRELIEELGQILHVKEEA
jgi:PilZ domain